MEYNVKKTDGIKIGAGWNQQQWQKADAIELKNFMGKKPEHFPKVQAKVLYDSDNIYVTFHVDDQYVKAVAQKFNDMVCRDSCVEFFFTPGEDISKGYFNIEANCGGTIYMYHMEQNGRDGFPLAVEDLQKITIKTSLPKNIDVEITTPVTWTAEYKIPMEILEKYAPVKKPAAGVLWRANFFKCADHTSKPHWLTWSPVDLPEPDFHQPSFFGSLKFC